MESDHIIPTILRFLYMNFSFVLKKKKRKRSHQSPDRLVIRAKCKKSKN